MKRKKKDDDINMKDLMDLILLYFLLGLMLTLFLMMMLLFGILFPIQFIVWRLNRKTFEDTQPYKTLGKAIDKITGLDEIMERDRDYAY